MKSLIAYAVILLCSFALSACTQDQLKGAGAATLRATCENHRDCTVSDSQ